MIYLDNSATTRVLEEAAKTSFEYMTNNFFNPSAMYNRAVEVERNINIARDRIASSLGASQEEIVYTSGGTESNNIAILGTAAMLRPGKWKFITSNYEHPAVYDVFSSIEKSGHEIIRIMPDEKGRINPQDIYAAVDERTALVSIMHVNNEIGTINDLTAIRQAIKKSNGQTVFHSDGVQAFTKLPFATVPADLYTISGHKFHAPKGVGALLMRNGNRNAGGLIGGGQEKGRRSGTTNSAGIMGMDTAIMIMRRDYAKNTANVRACKMKMAQNLLDINDVLINGPSPEEGAGHILNCSFLGVRGEVLLHSLEEKGIYLSTGSACSSHKKGKNRVLASIGISGERAEGAVRISLCPFNTLDEMDRAAQAIDDSLKLLRRFKRR